MLCVICHKDQPHGSIINDKFTCGSCEALQLVKPVNKKLETNIGILDVMTRLGIPKKIAWGLWRNMGIKQSALIRTLWIFRFIKSTKTIENNVGYFRAMLTVGKDFPIPEPFFNWYNNKMQHPDKNDPDCMYKNVI